MPPQIISLRLILRRHYLASPIGSKIQKHGHEISGLMLQYPLFHKFL